MSRHRAARPSSIRKTWVGATLVALASAGSVTALDFASSDASAAGIINLVADPGLSTGTQGWFTKTGGSLAVVSGHNGHQAIRLRNETAAPLTLALNDRVNTVSATQAGATYQASAWIRTDAPGISAAVRTLEYQRLVNRGGKLASAWLRSTDWVRVSVNYTAVTTGATLDYNVLAWALPRGKSLLVSEPSVVLISEPSQPIPVVSSSTFRPEPVQSNSSAPASSSKPSSAAAPTSVAPTSVAPTATVRPITSAPPSSSSAHAPVSSSVPTPSTPAASSSAPAPSGYQLVWSDDFDSIDRSKWNVRNNSWAHNEESIDTSRPENVFVANGALTLRAIKENYSAYGTTRQYTSGYLDTIGRASWQYGRIEMRAKLPAAQGMWPAFWLRDSSGLGELDIMEAVGGMVNHTVQTIHQSTNGDMARSGHEDVLPSGTFSDWHTYAVDREPGSVKWYVDDRLVFSKTVSTLSWLEGAFSEPMNIRLNLQVGGSMPAYYQKPVNGAPLGASDYVIDYVRVYQQR